MSEHFYTRTRTRQTKTRHDLGLAAEAIRDRIHFAKLGRKIGIGEAAEIFREIGSLMDEFATALCRECGEDGFNPKTEPFYDVAHDIACVLEERRRELMAAEEDDHYGDRADYAYEMSREP